MRRGFLGSRKTLPKIAAVSRYVSNRNMETDKLSQRYPGFTDLAKIAFDSV